MCDTLSQAWHAAAGIKAFGAGAVEAAAAGIHPDLRVVPRAQLLEAAQALAEEMIADGRLQPNDLGTRIMHLRRAGRARMSGFRTRLMRHVKRRKLLDAQTSAEEIAAAAALGLTMEDVGQLEAARAADAATRAVGRGGANQGDLHRIKR